MPPSTPPTKVKARSAKERAQDGLVMQTNSSSIVSKRSVERIYYPNEPHFFRYFVNKFQRRAPLINRGYHLRLHVIDTAVRRFLESPTDKTKVVVNLGCGSDVLPWQCITRYPDACHGAKFIDIDFPDLMEKKRAVVLATPELASTFDPLNFDVADHVLLKSQMYFQIGCDLRNTEGLNKALSVCCDISNCTFLFVAEVSITYMETQGADGVIKWASSLGKAEFCLLEQILPEGPDHPFAEKMLSHFEKLRTPPKSVIEYPRLKSQRARFSRLGWSWIQARSLWQIWTQDDWISSTQRRELDDIEPFDEWEEFALFASHYCVVLSKNYPVYIGSDSINLDENVPSHGLPPSMPLPLSYSEYRGTRGKRRFGAPLHLRDDFGQEVIANTYGLGTNNRLRSCDLYASSPSTLGMELQSPGPGGRVCHALVDLDHFGSLLIGGRTSPVTVLRDCWRFSLESNSWLPVEDLPVPLYRPMTTRLGKSRMVLLIGGKSNSSSVFGDALVYRPGSGWTQCITLESPYQPVFGGTLFSFERQFTVESTANTTGVQFKGILMGGLLQDGVVSRRMWSWTLTLGDEKAPFLALEPLNPKHFGNEDEVISAAIHRFGASIVPLSDSSFAILGGIVHNGIVSRCQELVTFNVQPSSSNLEILTCSFFDHQKDVPRPLLVGTSVTLSGNGQLVLMGGGATCFSMGTFWNEGSFTSAHALRAPGGGTHAEVLEPLQHCRTVETTDYTKPATSPHGNSSMGRASIKAVPRKRIETKEEFMEALQAGNPVVIEGSNLGECMNLWTTENLKAKVGSQRMVVVHEATSSRMDFNAKNFIYSTKSFGTFISEVEGGGRQYLRALSEPGPSALPANLKIDFPGLASDFQLPPELSFVEENLFSSVLRISGRVNMWLHYDVMANVYCQITGSKRLLLFPPEDVHHLSFAPGASSSSIDVFSELDSPALSLTSPHEAKLEPGDILFLPPTWLHATAPLSDMGVAVNVFFRNLEAGYSTGRDIYGNRDVAAYEKGRQDIARVANSLSKMPRDMRMSYMRRLADELAAKIVD
ncbi:leucine carboxyl methyltransferase [Xylariaceae sp. FL0255]|nr:leucine carboxyl methyltransferase [Xylariaceae sp. FL0255]